MCTQTRQVHRIAKKHLRSYSIIGHKCLFFLMWRRERDSNPRYPFEYTRFPGVLLQPLGHLSRSTKRNNHRVVKTVGHVSATQNIIPFMSGSCQQQFVQSMCQDILGRIFEPLSYMLSTATRFCLNCIHEKILAKCPMALLEGL